MCLAVPKFILSSLTEWLDEACEIPLDSVLVCNRPGCGGFWRRRLLNFGISNGNSPKSTDVALPDVHASYKFNK